jgi:succinoglycan biosynthesis protein ExoM
LYCDVFRAAQTRVSVDVCICTYRRSQLAQALQSIAAQRHLEDVELRVIVADNDAVPSARSLAEETAAALGLRLTYLHAPAHNISVARNACLAEARADWIAFLDDDETAEPLWLSRLLTTARSGRWDAVLGYIQAVYRPEAKAWLRRGDFHSGWPSWVRGEILTGYTCNVLIRREAIGEARFDVRFGRSGGEDVDFFYRFTDRGGRIGYSPDALVYDPVPEARESFGWLTRRWFRYGQSHGVRVLRRARHPIAGALAAPAAAGKVAAYLLAALVAFPFDVLRRKAIIGAAMHAGVVSRLMGGRLLEMYGQAGAAPQEFAVIPAGGSRSEP